MLWASSGPETGAIYPPELLVLAEDKGSPVVGFGMYSIGATEGFLEAVVPG